MPSDKHSLFKPRRVHFVGSVPLASTKDVFERLTITLPSQLLRIPDGETGKRNGFVAWQKGIFEGSDIRIKSHTLADKEPRVPSVPTSSANLAPSYADYAVESYKNFCRLHEQGNIPQGTRFQVALPTPVNVICCIVHPDDQVCAEPLYEAAHLSCLRHIQDTFPSHDLAIQWDLAIEFALLERILRFTACVDEGVEMGFHLRYGDAGHRHFIQPRDTSLLVDMANRISDDVGARDISWIHIPVPIDRVDEAVEGAEVEE